MNRIRFTQKVLILTFLTLLSASAYAYRPTYTYSAKVQAGLSTSSTGGGRVYVDEEATGYITVPDNKWRPNASENGSEGGNSSNTENASVTVYLYATANSGYQFDGWADNDTGTPDNKGTSVDGVYRTTQNFLVGNNDYGPYYTHPYREKKYQIYAFFSPVKYYIEYDANGGTVSPSTPQEYTIRSTDPLRTPTRNGYRFIGWKVVDYDPDDGNWEGGTIAGSPLNHKFGNVGLEAQWEEEVADITIKVTGLDSSESAIFTVSNGGGVLYTVALSGSNPSVRVKNLPTGVQYTVQATNTWSWAYNNPSPTSEVFSLGTSGYTAEFTYTKKSPVKKHDEKSNTNWR